MDSTMPSDSSFRASSWQSQRDRETPSLSGISHASFTRCSATSGGKRWLSPPPGFVLESLDSLCDESRNPRPDDAAPHPDDSTGFRDVLAFRDQQNGTGSARQPGRHTGGAHPTPELILFFLCKGHNIRRFPSTHADCPPGRWFQFGLLQMRENSQHFLMAYSDT